jgi:hypothetical protein
MTADISLLVAAGVLLVSAWALLVLYCWLTRERPITVIKQSDYMTWRVTGSEPGCRCYLCDRDRLTPRNS